MERHNYTADQLIRKKRSEGELWKHGIIVNEYLPCIESEKNTEIRTKDEITNRALALCFVALKGEGLQGKRLEKLKVKYNINDKLSPKEKNFSENSNASYQNIADATWRYESLWVMLWALCYLDKLDYPSELCDPGKAVGIISKYSEVEFKFKAKVRSKSEILDEADLIYRFHWSCVNSQLQNDNFPDDLDLRVVSERHYSLNWLINAFNEEWDNVSTDT